jgi:hypothetical protein
MAAPSWKPRKQYRSCLILLLFVFLAFPPLLGDFPDGIAGVVSKAVFIIAAVGVALALILDFVGYWRSRQL